MPACRPPSPSLLLPRPACQPAHPLAGCMALPCCAPPSGAPSPLCRPRCCVSRPGESWLVLGRESGRGNLAACLALGVATGTDLGAQPGCTNPGLCSREKRLVRMPTVADVFVDPAASHWFALSGGSLASYSLFTTMLCEHCLLGFQLVARVSARLPSAAALWPAAPCSPP